MSGMNQVVAGVTALILLAATAAAVARDDASTAGEQATELDEPSLEREARAAERALRRAERSFERASRVEAAADAGVHAEEIDAQMREAEERLAEAAARIAELSTRRLPQITSSIVDGLRAHNRAVLGITLDMEGERRPVEGVTVAGVTPGSAAAEAGLRAGDVITAVNGETLGADTDQEANEKLVDFMAGVQEGDTLEIEYLRDGRSDTVEVRPRRASFHFAWRAPGRPGMAPPAPPAPGFFAFHAGIGSWGDMEMVSLTEDLGRYFGTDKGLLVVRAPADENLKLRDGDVIQSIDGREPSSVGHAMRILASYQGGEELDLEIMRDRKRQTLRIEMPDNRQSSLLRRGSAAPVFRFRSTAPATP